MSVATLNHYVGTGFQKTQMANLDTIIDRYAMKPHELQNALKNVADTFNVRYFCQDGFTVTYNEVKSQALYHFPSHPDKPLNVDISPEQRDYFLKTQYWTPL